MVLKDERMVYPVLNVSAVLRGVLAALVLTILGSALLGVVYQLTNLSEKTLPATATVLFFTSIVIGSFIAARVAGVKGLLHGVVVAVLFLLLGWLIAVVFFDFKAVAGNMFAKGGLSLLAGAAGGVLGVGFSR